MFFVRIKTKTSTPKKDYVNDMITKLNVVIGSNIGKLKKTKGQIVNPSILCLLKKVSLCGLFYIRLVEAAVL